MRAPVQKLLQHSNLYLSAFRIATRRWLSAKMTYRFEQFPSVNKLGG
jgi:hypothetical protein